MLPRPSDRLLFWFALVVLPFSIIGPLIPGTMPVALAAIGGFLLVAFLDGGFAHRALEGHRFELPPLVRMQKDRPGQIELTLHRLATQRQVLRVGLVVPESVVPAEEERAVLVERGATRVRLAWHATPRARGKFALREVVAETASPLGFWSGRLRQEITCELRVYPDLFSERRQVSAVFLRRGPHGGHRQRQAGQGREFEKLRHYLPGDSLSDIHWKATAKRQEAVTKVYQVERSHEVYVILDASRLSARGLPSLAGQPPGTALERYVTAALVLALAAEQQGDRFGLITFSDRVLKSVRAGSGQAHFDRCRDALYTLEAQSVAPDFEELGTFVRLHLRKRALLVVLTALDDPVLAESFTKAVELIARQHLIYVNLLEMGGLRPLFSAETPVATVDDIYEALGGHLRWQKVRELRQHLRRRGVRLSLLDPARLSAELVAQHAEVRARQLV